MASFTDQLLSQRPSLKWWQSDSGGHGERLRAHTRTGHESARTCKADMKSSHVIRRWERSAHTHPAEMLTSAAGNSAVLRFKRDKCAPHQKKKKKLLKLNAGDSHPAGAQHWKQWF